MLRKLLLMVCCLLIAPLASFGYEAWPDLYVGAWSEHGKPTRFAYAPGQTSVIASDTARHYEVTMFTGYFHADAVPDVQGISTFVVTSKIIPLSSLMNLKLSSGIGGLYQVKDTEDATNLDIMFKTGLVIGDYVTLSLFGTWLPKEGADATFLGIGVNLSP